MVEVRPSGAVPRNPLGRAQEPVRPAGPAAGPQKERKTADKTADKAAENG